MEVIVERVIVFQRLNSFQLKKVHEVEAKRGSLLYASEVRDLLTLPGTLKHWGIPESNRARDVGARQRHFDRIKAQLVKAECVRELGPRADATSVDRWHAFDLAVQDAVNQRLIDLKYRRGGSLFDEVEEIDRMQAVAP